MRELNIVNSSQVALVDDEDYETLHGFRWFLAGGKPNRRYVARFVTVNKKGRTVYLHREVTACPQGMQVDHKNNDPLDCTRSNLRICTCSQNRVNVKKFHHAKSHPATWSVYRGVRRNRNLFEARITVDRKNMCIGFFSREHHAAMAYDIAARDVNGEFASLNFPILP